MTYQETLEYLYKSTPVFEHVGASAYKEGLYNTQALDAFFGHPHQAYKTIHIAGTNGKGSCSYSLAAILQADGYKVGLYTSPHIIDFKERIKVNGKCIDESYVIDFVKKHRSFFEPLHPSFFELTTAMALKYFSDSQVDIAVIEVGLGGRLDCTNIITPILSVITNISLDHTQFLGTTLAQIAKEKGGIIKPGRPVVIGESNHETRPVFLEYAEQNNSQIIFAGDVTERIVMSSSEKNAGGRQYTLKNGDCMDGDLSGDYQEKNMNTVLVAARKLQQMGLIRKDESIKIGISNVIGLTGLLGRWQYLSEKPCIVCDTGHNSGGWSYLAKQIARQSNKVKRIVFGMVDDKDLEEVMSMLPKDAIYYWTQPSTHRAFPVAKIEQCGRSHGLEGQVFHDVVKAYHQALKEASPEDFIFIGGSSYVVSDLLSEI